MYDFQGTLRINPKNFEEAFIDDPVSWNHFILCIIYYTHGLTLILSTLQS